MITAGSSKVYPEVIFVVNFCQKFVVSFSREFSSVLKCNKRIVRIRTEVKYVAGVKHGN